MGFSDYSAREDDYEPRHSLPRQLVRSFDPKGRSSNLIWSGGSARVKIEYARDVDLTLSHARSERAHVRRIAVPKAGLLAVRLSEQPSTTRTCGPSAVTRSMASGRRTSAMTDSVGCPVPLDECAKDGACGVTDFVLIVNLRNAESRVRTHHRCSPLPQGRTRRSLL